MWISIEDELPMMSVNDMMNRGFRIVRCKFSDEREVDCGVGDHYLWYFDVKRVGITHWFKDDLREITAKPIKND